MQQLYHVTSCGFAVAQPSVAVFLDADTLAALDLVRDILGLVAVAAAVQGLTHAHYHAQRKRFLWDRGCI